MQWRVTLDVPYNFAVEPGWGQSVQAGDFKPVPNGMAGTWREPTTGIIMLEPSFVNRTYKDTSHGLVDFTAKSGFWQSTKNGFEKAEGLTNVRPSGSDGNLIETLINRYLILISALETAPFNNSVNDSLKWVLRSSYFLEQDEGWGLAYHSIGHEIHRRENWISIAWDNILLHFSQKGICRVYRFANRAILSQAPTFEYEFRFSESGEMMNRPGYLQFIPIPQVGLLFMHSHTPTQNLVQMRNVNTSTMRTHLIPHDSYPTPDGVNHMFERSVIDVAVNPCFGWNMVFQQIRFSSTPGTVLDKVIQPAYKPSQLPAQVQAGPLLTKNQNITAKLIAASDGVSDWAVGEKAGQVKCTLTASADQRYSPFLNGYQVAWAPVFANRNTTPVVLSNVSGTGKQDKLLNLEWTDDEWGQFEGQVTALIETTACRKIMERGDATFLLEYSADSGAHWTTVAGGFAKDFTGDTVITANGTHYLAHFAIKDMRERFTECHLLNILAFDALDGASMVYNILNTSGFPPLASVPTRLNQVKLPKILAQNMWRFQSREGDSYLEMLDILLKFMNQQGHQWRYRYDWTNVTWVFEEKAHDLATYWQLTPHTSAGGLRAGASLTLPNVGSRIVAYSKLSELTPEPPEGNVVNVQGCDNHSPQGRRIPATKTNYASINDPTDPDYMGRMVIINYPVWPITDPDMLNAMCAQIYDAAAHRRFKAKAEFNNFYAGLAPNVQVRPLDEAGNPIPKLGATLPMWIKKRSVKVDMVDVGESMSLDLDSVWEGSLKTT